MNPDQEAVTRISRTLRFCSVALSCVIALAAIAPVSHAQLRVNQPPVLSGGEWNADAQYRTRQRQFDALIFDADRLSDAHVQWFPLTLDEEDRLRTGDDCASCGGGLESETIGINVSANVRVDFQHVDLTKLSTTGRTESSGLLRKSEDDRLVWTTAIHTPDAGAIKLRLDEVQLPNSVELYVYNQAQSIFGPYSAQDIDGLGGIWTNLLSGEALYIELRTVGAATQDDLDHTSFVLADVAHFSQASLQSELFARVQPDIQQEASSTTIQTKDASCYDTSDWSLIDYARKAIAYMIFYREGEWKACTGGLMANTRNDTSKQYFLSAEHCINSQTQANTLECVWRYQTTSCDLQYVHGFNYDHLPRTRGATLLASDRRGDYGFLRLSESPPAGSIYLGWNSVNDYTRDIGSDFRVLSHPRSRPLSYSKHTANGSILCAGVEKISAANNLGMAAKGSSGAPVMLVSDQVIGLASAVCCNSPPDSSTGECAAGWEDDPSKHYLTVGSFYHIYPSIRQWLAPDVGDDFNPTSGCNMSSIAGPGGNGFTDGLESFAASFGMVIMVFFALRRKSARHPFGVRTPISLPYRNAIFRLATPLNRRPEKVPTVFIQGKSGTENSALAPP